MTIGDIGSIATALAVLVAAWQVRQNTLIHQADYEDAFDRQYRELAMIIPVDAFLELTYSEAPNAEFTEARMFEMRETIFNYFDLTNEQIYQRSKNRISDDTWLDWEAGMRANMELPAFRSVWSEVQNHKPGMFTYLENAVRHWAFEENRTQKSSG